MQVPLAVAPSPAAHTSQPPEHGESQHFPSVQNPETHWLAVVHVVPVTSLGTHALPLQ